MVVISSPTFRLLRISSAAFFFLFSGRMSRKYMTPIMTTIIRMDGSMDPAPPAAAAILSI